MTFNFHRLFGVPAAAAASDAFPSRRVRIIVNTAPGGLTDVAAQMQWLVSELQIAKQ